MADQTATDGTDEPRATEPGQLWRHAAVVKTTMDDPVNDREAGTVLIAEGKCEDGVAYSVLSDEGYRDITCEVLEVFEADQKMSKQDINDWAAQKANQSDMDYGSA